MNDASTSSFAAMAQVVIHTDGSASGNPGPGGTASWKAAGIARSSGADSRRTTNNRMELLAVIAGLGGPRRPGMEVLVVSDSKYVVGCRGERLAIQLLGEKGSKQRKRPGPQEAVPAGLLSAPRSVPVDPEGMPGIRRTNSDQLARGSRPAARHSRRTAYEGQQRRMSTTLPHGPQTLRHRERATDPLELERSRSGPSSWRPEDGPDVERNGQFHLPGQDPGGTIMFR